jgi:hypothetical protein
MSHKAKALTYQCQICKEEVYISSFYDIHHIEHRATTRGRNGTVNNAKYNLVCLCPSDHRRLHLGEIIIDRWVQTTDGYKLMCIVGDDFILY